MTTKRKRLLIALAIVGLSISAVCTFLLLHVVLVQLDKPHARRLHRMAEFTKIGKSVAAHLRTEQPAPATLEELLSKGWLSPFEISFVRTNEIAYFAPTGTGAAPSIILKMPTREGNYVIERDGYMRAEHGL